MGSFQSWLVKGNPAEATERGRILSLRERARALPARYDARVSTRRAAALEQRTQALAGKLAPTATSASALAEADLSATMRVAWELVAGLRSSLLSLEERAARVVPAEVAGLIALWTQLHTFDRTGAKILIWTAWVTLLAAVITLGRLVMPSRLDRFWDSLVPPEVVLARLGPLEPAQEAVLASHTSGAIHLQIERLRRGFRLAVTMSVLALLLTSAGYVIERW